MWHSTKNHAFPACSEEKIAELMTNGLSRADAVQALHDSG